LGEAVLAGEGEGEGLGELLGAGLAVAGVDCFPDSELLLEPPEPLAPLAPD